jgi:hypothetical protein
MSKGQVFPLGTVEVRRTDLPDSPVITVVFESIENGPAVATASLGQVTLTRVPLQDLALLYGAIEYAAQELEKDFRRFTEGSNRDTEVPAATVPNQSSGGGAGGTPVG